MKRIYKGDSYMKKENADAVIEYCNKNGIQLWREGDRLKYKASGVSVTGELIEKFKKHKYEILSKLQEKEMDSIQINSKDQYELFPVSDVQSAYLLGRNGTFQYGDVACHIYLEITYDNLELDRVKKTWEKLINRHDMLRAVINEDGTQIVLQEVSELMIPYFDVKREDKAKIEAFIESMKTRVYELGNWPMFGVAISDYEEKTVMHLSIEFLIADWTSIWMLLSEFETLYFEPNTRLPEIKICFRDYIFQERKLKKSLKYEQDKQYWMEKILECPGAPELPLIHTQKQSGKFQRKSFILENEKWVKFKKTAKSYGITPTTAVLEAYAHVIGKWSINKCFCLNLTVLNRKPIHVDIEKVVGDFTTLNLTKIDHRKGTCFSECARQTNKELFENLDHSLFSGVEVLRELSRNNNGNSVLMPIVFTSAIGLLGESGHLRGKFENQGISQTPQVFIDCQVMDGEFGLQINWDYREGIFPDGMLDDMFQAYGSLMERLSEFETEWEMEEELISIPEWQSRERIEMNATDAAREDKLLFEEFMVYTEQSPKKIAVVDETGEHTYEELDSLARSIASRIVQAGGREGDNIPIVMKKCRHQVAAVLGIMYMGGCYVPLEADQAEERCEEILKDIHATIVVTKGNIKYKNREEIQRINVDEMEQSGSCENFVISAQEAGKRAYIIYTSGSSGKPKGVSISHRAAYNTIKDINLRFGIHSEDCVLGISKLNFDLSVYDIFGLLSVGGKIVYPDSDQYMNPTHWLELIEKHRISVWNSVPALMNMLLNHDKGKALETIKKVFLSGDWIPLDMPEKIKKLSPKSSVICMGGATEASIWSIFHEYRTCFKDWISIPYGKPLTNQGWMVLNERFEDCPVWVKGDLYITGTGLAIEYYGDFELTQKKFILHPVTNQRLYQTGDKGRYLPEGEIEFLGREDKQVKIYGHRIELGEIEHVIESIETVASCVAFVKNNEINAMIEMEYGNQLDVEQKEREFDLAVDSLYKREQWFEDIGKEASLSLEYRNKASAISLLFCFQSMKLLTYGHMYSENQINRDFRSISKYKWLIKPWLTCLLQNKLISFDGNGYTAVKEVNEKEVNQEWEQANRHWNDKLGDGSIITYIEGNAKKLADILEGNLDPLGLLYPDGSDIYVKALYKDNTVTTFINHCMAEFLSNLSEIRGGRKLRILEIGAGSGATTQILLNEFKGKKYEYCYSDSSKYFFQEAKKMFGEIEGVSFKTLDIDQDVFQQGFRPNSYDVIISSYVLENAADIKRSLERIETLLAPQGYLVFASPLRDEEWLLASQALMMEKAKDSLRGEEVFMDQYKWKGVLNQYGAGEDVFCIPKMPNEDAKRIGLNLFIKPMKQSTHRLNHEELHSTMKKYLPDYMIPKDIIVVDKMPLSKNGKLDHKKIHELYERFHQKVEGIKTTAYTATGFQKQLATIFEEVLKADAIGIYDNLYDFGADSLSMAQAAARIRSELTMDLPFERVLRQILNTPSIEKLDVFFSENKRTVAVEDEERKALPKEFAYIRDFGGDSENRIRILLHNGLGIIENYEYLGKYLAMQNKGSVYAIGIADVETYCNLNESELLEFLVDTYTKIIAKTGKTRIQLIGYCYSGTIAVEMARKLMEEGYEVEDVCVIDGGSMPITITEDFMNELLFVNMIGLTVKDIGFNEADIMETVMDDMIQTGNRVLKIEHLIKFYREKSEKEPEDTFYELQKMTQKERFENYQNLYRVIHSKDFELKLMFQLYRIFRQSFQVYRTPGIYFGNIRYFSVLEKVGMFKYLTVMIDEWKGICMGKFTMEQIKGDHFSCIENPENALELAALLAE